MRIPPARWRHSCALFAALTLGSCSSDTTEPPAGGTTDDFIRALPSWSEFSPPLPDANDIVAPATATQEIVGRTRYRCTSAPYSITQTPDKIVTMDPDANILWLGALLQGRGYKEGIGSLAEWSVRERAPLQVSIDLLSGASSRTVERPDLAAVQQAIGSLVQEAVTAGHRGGSSVSYSMQKTHHIVQAGLAMGLSMKYMGATIKANLNTDRSASETTVTAHFVQRMFNASIVMPNTPGDLFSPAFTPARLQEERDAGHVSASNIPVYVASIVYGRSLLFTFTSTTSEDSIRAALSANLDDQEGEISGRLKTILETSRVGVVTVGGEGRNATALIQSGNLPDYFNEEASLTSARPISYTVRNLGDNSIAKVSETSEYDLRECAAVPSTGDLTVDVTPNDATVSILGPGGYQYGPKTGDQYLLDLAPGGYSIAVSRDGYLPDTSDVSLAAGDLLEHPVALQPANQTIFGAIYDITPVRLDIANASCTGESQADVFHDISVNTRALTNRPEASSIPLYAGESDDPGKGPDFWFPTVRDTIWFEGSRRALAFRAVVRDADLNAADPMSSSSWNYLLPNVPTGPNLFRNLNVTGASCFTTFRFSITKVADMFTPGPT